MGAYQVLPSIIDTIQIKRVNGRGGMLFTCGSITPSPTAVWALDRWVFYSKQTVAKEQ